MLFLSHFLDQVQAWIYLLRDQHKPPKAQQNSDGNIQKDRDKNAHTLDIYAQYNFQMGNQIHLAILYYYICNTGGSYERNIVMVSGNTHSYYYSALPI